jgi:hypothetical protein
MDAQSEPCEIASRHLVRTLHELETATTNPQCRKAAAIAALALLAIRDTAKRAEHPEIAEGRLNQIRDLLRT